MPSYLRKSQDQRVDGICASVPTRIETPHGALVADTGDWIFTDFSGDHHVVSKEEVVSKFEIDPADPNSLTYYQANEWFAPPTITQIEPTSGAVGSTVYIKGTNFGATQGSSGHVWFGIVNLIEATVTSWSDTLIACQVPTGAPTTYPIWIKVETGAGISGVSQFQVT